MPVSGCACIITYLWAKREVFQLPLVSCGFFLFYCVSSLASLQLCLPILPDELMNPPGQVAAPWFRFLFFFFFYKALNKVLKAVRFWL